MAEDEDEAEAEAEEECEGDLIKGRRVSRLVMTSPRMGIWASTTLLMFLGWISKWMIPPRPCDAARRAAGANPVGWKKQGEHKEKQVENQSVFPNHDEDRDEKLTVDFASDTIIKSSTKSNDYICLLHRKVGIRRTMHAQHMQTLVIQLVIRTETLKSRRDRNITQVRQLFQQLGAFSTSEETITSIDDRSLGLVDQVCCLRDEGRRRRSSDHLSRVLG